ncbi:MAG: NAD(P)/FAD-dependent oxidoreductase [Clostridiaceae bacterium]
MDYDVLILGGGIVGCAAAYELSKYNLNIALIEKDYDIADDVALVNSAIVYDGAESDDSLMSKLEFMGSELMPEITSKFNVPYKKCGFLIVAEDMASEKNVEELYEKAIARGIKNVSLLSGEEVQKMEPNLRTKALKALYSTNTAVTLPYDLAIAYGEVAFDNGVNFKLEEEVLDIKKINKGYKVITNKNRFTCNIVVNTTPNEDYSFDVKEKLRRNKVNMEYFLMGESIKSNFSSIIMTKREKERNLSVVPNIQGSAIVSLYTKENMSYRDTLDSISQEIGPVGNEDIKTYRRAEFHNDSLIIDDSMIHQGYIKVVGKHYGLVAMTPAIATIVCETIKNNNKNCTLKKNYIDKRRDFFRFRDLDNEQRNMIIKMNKDYGKIICACSFVTEGEIVDSIRRPLGARTIEGIKRRTGAMSGFCGGSNCLVRIAAILSRETDKPMTEIVKDSKNSKLVVGRIKEFDEM